MKINFNFIYPHNVLTTTTEWSEANVIWVSTDDVAVFFLQSCWTIVNVVGRKSLVRWKKSNMSTFSSTQFVLKSHSNALFLRHTRGRKKIILIGAERALSSLIFLLQLEPEQRKKWGKKIIENEKRVSN